MTLISKMHLLWLLPIALKALVSTHCCVTDFNTKVVHQGFKLKEFMKYWAFLLCCPSIRCRSSRLAICVSSGLHRPFRQLLPPLRISTPSLASQVGDSRPQVLLLFWTCSAVLLAIRHRKSSTFRIEWLDCVGICGHQLS